MGLGEKCSKLVDRLLSRNRTKGGWPLLDALGRSAADDVTAGAPQLRKLLAMGCIPTGYRRCTEIKDYHDTEESGSPHHPEILLIGQKSQSAAIA
jgi:hypothetical protein